MPITECVKCAKPLGSQSQDDGFIVCHDCRNCEICHNPVTPDEIQFINADNTIVRHAKCWVVREYKTNGAILQDSYQPTQADVKELNHAILINPNMEVSLASDMATLEAAARKSFEFMSYEAIVRSVEMMESIAATGRGWIRKNSNKPFDVLKAEQQTRETKKNNKVKEQEKILTLQQETERAEKEKNLKGQELSNHVKRKNYEKFLLMRQLKDDKFAKDSFKAMIGFMKYSGIIRTIDDADRIEFKDEQFERIFKFMNL